MTHDHFMIAALAAQRDFQGVPAEIWDYSERAGRQLVNQYNKAIKHVLGVYDAIANLQTLGYLKEAPVSEKKQELAFALRLSLS